MAKQEIRADSSRPALVATQASFGSVLIGALIALACQIALALLGVAIGLIGFDPATGRWSGRWVAVGAGGWLALTLMVSFFVGGFVATRVSGQTGRSGAQWHGLGVWGLLEVAYLFFLGSALSSAGGMVVKAGAGAAGAAGVAGSMEQVGQYLSKIRIVTDMSVMKGKAVTEFQLPGAQQAGAAQGPAAGSPRQKAGAVAKKGKKEVERAVKPIERGAPAVREAAGEVRKVAEWITWPAFGAAVVSGLFALLGGLYGRRRVLREVAGRS